MAYRDQAERRAADRERFRKRTERRRAAGLCPRCGVRRPQNGLTLCGECAEKRRASDRARDARRRQVRLDGGTCVRCGRRPPVDGGVTCEPCRQTRQAHA